MEEYNHDTNHYMEKNLATSRKPRLTLSLDEDSLSLLTELETFTGLSPAQTIQKLFPAHLEELHEYLRWLKQVPEGSSIQRNLGKYLLHNYGPDSLITAIKRVDPTYQTEAEKFSAGLKS